MADFHAIKSVSATLRALLVDRMDLPDGMTTVPTAGLVTIPITIGPPPPTPKDDALRDEFERIKLSLEPLTLEDVTKVWSALLQRYRLSAAYVVNVVQIQSQRPRRFVRPVGQPVSATIPPPPTDPPSPGPMVYV